MWVGRPQTYNFCLCKKMELPERGKKIETTTVGLIELSPWLHGEGVYSVAMESTGVYRIPVWHAPESYFKLILVNPYFIKQMPGRKSDVADAQWIATLLDKQLLRSSVVPERASGVSDSISEGMFSYKVRRLVVYSKLKGSYPGVILKIAFVSSVIGSKTVLE